MSSNFESLPLTTKYGTGQLEASSLDQKEIRNDNSIGKEFRTTAQKGTASRLNVGINLAKTAAGTGILALPYACKRGGLFLFVSGMFLISFWNVYCMKQLCETYEYLVIRLEENSTKLDDRSFVEGQQKRSSILGCSKVNIEFRDPPPEGTSAFSKLGWYVLGDFGRWTIDLMILMLLLFINIALETAIISFFEPTPFSSGDKLIDGTILGSLLLPFCMVDDMSSLSKLSRLGLLILGFALTVVSLYGIVGKYSIDDSINNATGEKTDQLNLFPLDGIEGVSKWFGCVVFSFGIVPLTFNFRESMAEPEKLPQTAMISMTIVGTFYVLIGVFFLHLFPNINNDLLSEMPPTGVIATLTRIAMIVVVMASIPLITVPCGEIIEGKLMRIEDGRECRSRKGMVIIRASILLGTFSIAAKLPGFVTVLAFVGSFAVSIVSFVLPPCLHWLMLAKGFDQADGIDYSLWSRICDFSMLLIGISTTVITTWFTRSA